MANDKKLNIDAGTGMGIGIAIGVALGAAFANDSKKKSSK